MRERTRSPIQHIRINHRPARENTHNSTHKLNAEESSYRARAGRAAMSQAAGLHLSSRAKPARSTDRRLLAFCCSCVLRDSFAAFAFKSSCLAQVNIRLAALLTCTRLAAQPIARSEER